MLQPSTSGRARPQARSVGVRARRPRPGCCAQSPEVEMHGEDERGAVLMHSRSGQVRGLNATGLFIWRLCDGSRDVPALVDALCQAFEDVPEDVVSDQVISFLEALLAAGMLCMVDAQAGPALPPSE